MSTTTALRAVLVPPVPRSYGQHRRAGAAAEFTPRTVAEIRRRTGYVVSSAPARHQPRPEIAARLAADRRATNRATPDWLFFVSAFTGVLVVFLVLAMSGVSR